MAIVMAESGVSRMRERLRSYFFLSYAHSNPMVGFPGTDTDLWVRKFFGDLVTAVRRHASRRSEFISGFFDQQIPVGSDLKESLREALSVAEVFVPLYSASYLATSWPGREWACFHQRVMRAGVANPGRRIVPVLWSPLTEAQHLRGLDEALALGADQPDYVENGLQALLKISPYHDVYERIVNQVARRIVLLVEQSPIGPSEAPDFDQVESAFMPEPQLPVFVIETAAPTAQTVAAGRDLRGYGGTSIEWRPFTEQELPLAEHARQVAERFDFKAEVTAIKTVRDPGIRRPGIILIDPWFMASETGQAVLKSALEKLPQWVLPLLILDQPDDRRAVELVGKVRDALGDAGALSTDSSRRAARGVSSLDDFVAIVPDLVTEAERQYLRNRGKEYGRNELTMGPVTSTRPSLRRPARPGGSISPPDPPASPSDRLGETPDA
ncbi:MAG: TIR-like protein FxsC [Streptosporangiaceae bacterium]